MRTLAALRSRRSLFALLALIAADAACAAGPSEAEIQRVIDRAVAYLKGPAGQGTDGANSLRAYALLKAGESAELPEVEQAIRRILEKCGSSYDPRGQHIYTAAVDLMALEAAGPETYLPQMQLIVDYLISKQNTNGSWDYVTSNRQAGDTSQTQYALLGLWAATRAGIEIPTAVWDGAARWHLATQFDNGGWTYHPDTDRTPSHTMTAAGIGSLHVCRMFLAPGAAPRNRSTRMIQPTRKFGILEPVDLGAAPGDAGAPQLNVPDDRPKISRGQIDAAIERGLNWLKSNYTAHAEPWPLYYLYTVERLAALADIETIGDHDWYAEGASFLLAAQDNAGTWRDNAGSGPAASFGVLFLYRATSKLLNRKAPTRLGGGLLVGGRGLPEDLAQVQLQDGKLAARKTSGPIDDLLAELERPNTLQVEAVQAALVEKIQVGDREQLIGETDRLRKLAADPRVEVRRTALWALGHTGELRTAPLLIEALRDPSIDINIEAHNALCTLSRNPLGLGVASDPFDGVPGDATEEQRSAALARWREAAFDQWRDWYLTVRPYDERDDLTRLRIGR